MKHAWRALLLLLPCYLVAHPYSRPERETTGQVIDETSKRITPDAGPSVNGGIDVFITADFLYWTGRMDGLSYVTAGLGNNITSVSRGKAYFPDWEWDAGFKVGLGHNLPHDGWDISTQYTWFHTSATDYTKGTTLDPNWDISNLGTFITSSDLPGSVSRADATWKLKYNVVDLELGRNYFISHYLSLRPHFGFKVSWQDIDYRIHYQVELSDQESHLRMKNDTDFWGIGLRSGLDTAWHINPVFSVYGDFALSALWSQYEVKRRDTRSDVDSNTSIITYDTEKDFHTLKPVLELSIGLRGEWWCSDNRYHFLVQAGWEEQLWINHNQFVKMHFAQSAHGDLILQGFTLKGRFDF